MLNHKIILMDISDKKHFRVSTKQSGQQQIRAKLRTVLSPLSQPLTQCLKRSILWRTAQWWTSWILDLGFLAPTGAQCCACMWDIMQLRVLRASKKGYFKGDLKGELKRSKSSAREVNWELKHTESKRLEVIHLEEEEPCPVGAC